MRVKEENREERKKVFAERLKQAMQNKGMKQKELAIRSDTKSCSVSHYLSAIAIPNKDALNRIADVLGVEPMWLEGKE